MDKHIFLICSLKKKVYYSGADSGFLERGLIYINVCDGFTVLISSHFSLISHENEIIIAYLELGHGEGV